MKLKRSFFIVSLFLVFTCYSCYTSFTHPPINDARWGEVYVNDDCLECHDSNRYSSTILPDAAQNDYNWQFYSGSAWWQDEQSIEAGIANDPDVGTGPRSISHTPTSAAPVAMPVQSGSTSLGKSSATEETEQKSPNKRSIGRRSNSTSSESSKENSSSNSRRR